MIITTILCTGMFFGLFSYPALAFNGWEGDINVTSGKAESRLAFGQKSDATDLTDGLYDLPAMLSGAMRVYFQTDGESLWRDIRAIGPNKEWQLQINSKTGKPIVINWNPVNFPTDANVMLVDTTNGKETDMKTFNSYTMEYTDNALLLIEVTKN